MAVIRIIYIYDCDDDQVQELRMISRVKKTLVIDTIAMLVCLPNLKGFNAIYHAQLLQCLCRHILLY